jgi:uncharacterized protein
MRGSVIAFAITVMALVVPDASAQILEEELESIQGLAEQGYAEAQYDLGLMYYMGIVVSQNTTESFRWFLKAAEQGHAWAQHSVGVIHAEGRDVSQDYIAGYMWWTVAAANGSESSADNLRIVSTRMTNADISEARRRARVCMETRYANCD